MIARGEAGLRPR